ncbi:dihydrofolate reductase family protein, partial [Pseudoroseomonas deserti]|uniref:dihydrofolate reductase family protein n=1 Tax=Teichococcus deserti TaxID=1817963 RepID=UPI0034636A40
MSRTLWHCHIAASLDGRIARADGSVDDWLAADYPAEDFGFAEFFAGVGAILMGRGTYDALQGVSPWPYAGKPVTVLTSRPIEAPPPDLETRLGDLRRSWRSWRDAAMAASGSRAAAWWSPPCWRWASS